MVRTVCYNLEFDRFFFYYVANVVCIAALNGNDDT